jgi:FkbM family methyltransferase
MLANTYREKTDYDDAWFLACAYNAQILFDVGAHMGHNALLALGLAGVKRIVLVEANPAALSLAADNLIQNRLVSNVSFVPSFASDAEDQKITFWTTGAGAAGSMYDKHAVTAATRGDHFEVPTTTVDAISEYFGLVPDLVKIDVESAEAKVLGGSRKLAAKKKTRFMVEVHSNPDLPMLTNAQLMISWCESAGYKPWYLRDHVELTTPQQLADRGRCHIMLQPADWPFPEWLKGIEQSAPLQKPRT